MRRNQEKKENKYISVLQIHIFPFLLVVRNQNKFFINIAKSRMDGQVINENRGLAGAGSCNSP